MRALRHTAAIHFLLALPLLLLCVCHSGAAENLKSAVKMRYSSPVVTVLVDGEPMNLVLTTDVDGILICSDLPKQPSSSAKIDFDYARHLLRYQLQGIAQEFVLQDLQVPAVNFTGDMPLGYFSLARQWLSPVSIECFLQSSRARGFIGIGFAFRPMYSRFWTMLPKNGPQRYAYRGVQNTTSKMALLSLPTDVNEEEDSQEATIALQDANDVASVVWSEPLASINERDDMGDNQGISFPIHDVTFQCHTSPLSSEEKADDNNDHVTDSSASTSPFSHKVEILGEYSSNWDVIVDFNTPCLVLPHQFFDAVTNIFSLIFKCACADAPSWYISQLASWLGLQYSDELKLAEFPSSKRLPDLTFALSLQGPRVTIPLQQLVLPELQVPAPSSSSDNNNNVNTKTRVCIQRSESIVQNGAAIFSPLEPEAGSVQRYRLHGFIALPLFNMIQAPIVFGAMVLNTFDEIVVDGRTKRTGVVRKKVLQPRNASFSPGSSDNAAIATCLPRAQCIGDQIYVHRINACQGLGLDRDIAGDDGHLPRCRHVALVLHATNGLQHPRTIVAVSK
ncbi:hypothetical protein FI667_g5587, partial [Globisporangium splendens]